MPLQGSLGRCLANDHIIAAKRMHRDMSHLLSVTGRISMILSLNWRVVRFFQGRQLRRYSLFASYLHKNYSTLSDKMGQTVRHGN